MNKQLISLISAFFLAIAVVPGNVGWATPTAYASESMMEHDEGNSSHADKERTMHDDKKNEKDHDHDGMHGMMMGHSKGWMIVIGAVMIVMMAAMVL